MKVDYEKLIKDLKAPEDNALLKNNRDYRCFYNTFCYKLK